MGNGTYEGYRRTGENEYTKVTVHATNPDHLQEGEASPTDVGPLELAPPISEALTWHF
jgi:hypothetical protein